MSPSKQEKHRNPEFWSKAEVRAVNSILYVPGRVTIVGRDLQTFIMMADKSDKSDDYKEGVRVSMGWAMASVRAHFESIVKAAEYVRQETSK